MTNETSDPGNGATGRRVQSRLVMWLLWAAVALMLVATIALAGGMIWFQHLLNGPVSGREFSSTVVIRKGDSYRTIVRKLRDARLLPHSIAFDYLAWRRSDSRWMKPGRYQFESSMSATEIYEALLRGAPIVVTVPEGWTLEQIDARLVELGIASKPGQFTRAAHDPQILASHDLKTSSAEGYLLPETYHVDPGVSAESFLETMLTDFRQSYAYDSATTAPEGLSWHEVLTLASMIEREARNEDEKPVIASVYYNRLRRGMKLDCDATVRYAISNWREPLTRADLQTTSPYNTYLYPGLPPGPICCVGPTSVEAALEPAKTDFFYYCYKGDQVHQFSKTLREHNAAVEKYLRKRLTTPAGSR